MELELPVSEDDLPVIHPAAHPCALFSSKPKIFMSITGHVVCEKGLCQGLSEFAVPIFFQYRRWVSLRNFLLKCVCLCLSIGFVIFSLTSVLNYTYVLKRNSEFGHPFSLIV